MSKVENYNCLKQEEYLEYLNYSYFASMTLMMLWPVAQTVIKTWTQVFLQELFVCNVSWKQIE